MCILKAFPWQSKTEDELQKTLCTIRSSLWTPSDFESHSNWSIPDSVYNFASSLVIALCILHPNWVARNRWNLGIEYRHWYRHWNLTTMALWVFWLFFFSYPKFLSPICSGVGSQAAAQVMAWKFQQVLSSFHPQTQHVYLVVQIGPLFVSGRRRNVEIHCELFIWFLVNVSFCRQ